jgi:hypothetical protein
MPAPPTRTLLLVYSGHFCYPSFFRAAPWSPERPGPSHPASPDARSCEPSPRTTAAGTPAFSRSETLQDRASGVCEGWVRCAFGTHRRRMRMGMSMRGSPQKNSHGPSLRPHHPPNPTFNARCPTRNGEALRRLRGCRRTPQVPSIRRGWLIQPWCGKAGCGGCGRMSRDAPRGPAPAARLARWVTMEPGSRRRGGSGRRSCAKNRRAAAAGDHPRQSRGRC